MKNNIKAMELHYHLLNMAKVFHAVCEQNSLKYYMLGGTMLGAVRHQGFIPWDDDMDFGMPRDDYNKFINIASEILPNCYEVRNYKNSEKSPFHYLKLIDNRTTLIEEGYHYYVEGLYIDIFPLDGAGNGTLLDRIRTKLIYFYQGLIINHCTTREKRGMRFVLKKAAETLNLNRLHNTIDTLMNKKKLSDSLLIANYLGSWHEREIMPKEIMGTPTLYKFEDTQFYGSEYADEYLERLYGDYMQLPPENKRIFRHDYYYVNFGLPYKVFLAQRKK